MTRVIGLLHARHVLLLSLTAIVPATAFVQPSTDIPALLDRNKSAIGITDEDISGYAVADMYTTQNLGVTHVYLEQRYRDIPVHNGILNLNIRDNQLLNFGNRWITKLQLRAPANLPGISARSAVERAATHLGQLFTDGREIDREENSLGQVVRVTFTAGNLSETDITSELVWLQGEAKEVLLCWMAEIHETDAENVWLIFIDAHTGAFVRMDNLVRHCTFGTPADQRDNGNLAAAHFAAPSAHPTLLPDSTYNVFALPAESPNHGMRTIEATPWHAAGPGNPAATLGWHDDGSTNYTVTRGNNVHAYEDMDANNSPGYSPDTNTLDFDYPFDPVLTPEDNVAASITNLFYWNNIIHDVMYQYGFDEVAGNFQNDNLGRGGLDEDYVRAEGHDGAGTNNANFFTPADGSRPRMQMYLWSPVPESSQLTINSPSSVMGPMDAVESDFSANNKLEDVGLTTGDLLLVEDDGDTTHIACMTLSNADDLAGKIAVIDRGNCTFVEKVALVQSHGAVAAIVINNVAESPIVMGGSDNSIVIPAVMISLDDGNLLKAVMDTAIVNASLDAVAMITPIGDFDNGIIIHEYGHGISNRLTGGPSNVTCLNNDEQMGEGWSDYFGLMLTTDWTTATHDDLRGIGTYVQGQTTDGTGIRTYPYTTDVTVNPFSYADIADNASVHFIGSVWCTMLWDMTWKIIAQAGADPDLYHGTGGNNIALQLVTDALKLQPCSPGFVDGRDAILLADQIRYGGQYACAIWEAFAGRGLGVDADQGSTDDHEDGMESFDVPEGVLIESTADVAEATEGREVTYTIKTTCDCTPKSDLLVEDVLSGDLIYIPGSGGVFDGNAVTFTADTLAPQDSMVFSYRAYVRPCSAAEPILVSEDNAEGPDQYASVKLQGNGQKQWVKDPDLVVSTSNSWYAQDYSNLADFALTLLDPVMVSGPVGIIFYHRYETEATFDGGTVEYSLNGGTTWEDAGPYFTENGYPAAITTVNTDSPIAGQEAFTGNSDVQFDTSGFIQSAIQLNIEGVQELLLRFRFVCDGAVGGPGINGWYVDDISITQFTGITNLTRVSAGGNVEDSLSHTLKTSVFDGRVVYVDQSASGERTGLTWTHAMHHLPLAVELAACRDADTVLVAEGTYLPGLTEDREMAFSLFDSTSLFGAFPAGGGSFAMRDPVMYQTVLSGNIGAENDNADNVYHVVKIDSARQDILLDGLTISHGNANGMDDAGSGAAVFCEGDLTLKDVTVSQNTGTGDGRVILVRTDTGQLVLHGCTIYLPAGNEGELLNTASGQVLVVGETVILLE